MKPIIGITPSTRKEASQYVVHRAHITAIKNAGGIPLIVPYGLKQETIRQIAETIDGLYLTGGGDIHPYFFHEEPDPYLGEVEPERDFFEIKLIQHMLTMQKPILGICRGCQILNIALGDTMEQHLYHGETDTPLIQHRQQFALRFPIHSITIDESSLLYKIVKQKKIMVNSNHHQANKTVVPPLMVSAHSKDQIIEAVESSAHAFVLGVQWHPEQLLVRQDKHAKAIYDQFIQACI